MKTRFLKLVWTIAVWVHPIKFRWFHGIRNIVECATSTPSRNGGATSRTVSIRCSRCCPERELLEALDRQRVLPATANRAMWVKRRCCTAERSTSASWEANGSSSRKKWSSSNKTLKHWTRPSAAVRLCCPPAELPCPANATIASAKCLTIGSAFALCKTGNSGLWVFLCFFFVFIYFSFFKVLFRLLEILFKILRACFVCWMVLL